MTRGESPLEEASPGHRLKLGLGLGLLAAVLAVGFSRTGPGRAVERGILDGHLQRASAEGADGVVLDASCCDPLYRKAIRVSVGAALRRLRWRGVDGHGAPPLDDRP